ncbi:MAG TPA: HNH endonuclease, partial [Longimicrobium sp.]|nr:HNH endonuclease [Longimicrobium sp.]
MRPITKFLWRPFMGDLGMWGTSRRFLVSTVGTYCSYCEVPLGVDLPIEHKAPKSDFFNFDNRYGNFLLACSACNSWKGARPDIDAARSFYAAYGGSLTGLDPDDPVNAYWLSLATMVWPDRLAGFAWDVGQIPPQLADFLGYPDDTLGLLTYSLSSTSAEALADEGLLRFGAGEGADAPWARELEQAVWVAPSAGLPAVQRERVLNTIQVLNLNYYNP